MPPKKGEPRRQGYDNRRAAGDASTSNTWGSSNAPNQPIIPPPTQTQDAAPQNSSVGNQNIPQRPGQQPEQRTNPPSSNALRRNNVNLPQRSRGNPSSQAQSSSHHNSTAGNQINASRREQQPVPNIGPQSYDQALRENLNRHQNSREVPSSQAQSSALQNSDMADQNSSQRSGQQLEPRSNPTPDSGIARRSVNSSQLSGESPRTWASVATVTRPKQSRASLPADNQMQPQKTLFPPGKNSPQGSPSNEVDTSSTASKSDAVTAWQGNELCVRPGYGLKGTPTDLKTNYFELKLPLKTLLLYTYNMIVEPDANNKVPKGDKKRQLIKLLLGHRPFQAILPKTYATDFNTTIVTKERLRIEQDESGGDSAKFVVDFKAEGAYYPPHTPLRYSILVKEISIVDISDLNNLLGPNKLSMEHHESSILDALNVILGHHAKEADSLTRVGNKKVFPLLSDPDPADFDLGRGLIALRGYYANAIGATSRALLNVNISHGAFYKSRFVGSGRSSLVDLMWARCPDTDYEDLHHFLRGLRVRTTHLSEEHKAYGKIRTICGLAMDGDGAKLANPPRFEGSTLGNNPWQVQFFEEYATNCSSRIRSSNDWSRTAPMTERETLSSESSTGSYITVKDFFDKTYPQHSARIVKEKKFRNPVVNVGTRARPIYLPAEVCEVLPGQVSRAKLDPDQTTCMIDFAKCDPYDCAASIVEEGRGVLGYASPRKPMSEFSVSVGQDLITVPGRVLSTPTIEYQRRVAEPEHGQMQQGRKQPKVFYVQTTEGSWRFINVRLYQTPTSEVQWQCLRIAFGHAKYVEKSTSSFNRILGKFWSIMTDYGIKSHRPPLKTKSAENLQDLVSEIEAFLNKLAGREANSGPSTQGFKGSNGLVGASKEQKVSDPPLLMVILPNNSNEIYRTIKTMADIALGMHTVCVIGDTNEKRKFYGDNAQYHANVILKINLKLGGMNHKLTNNTDALGVIGKGSTMVVGIDVTHPSPGSREGAPSIFAVVASMDQHLSQWPVRFGVQKKSREEVISNQLRLKTMFEELLKLWQAKHKPLLENIIVYRDGVSEGQYNAVIQQELAALRAACNSLRAKPPRITLIIVAKRHHTRFYPTDDSQADSSKNAKCGTVVDRGITKARTWDFFLQSHSVIKGAEYTSHEGEKVRKPSGTARPGHYVVLHDEVFAASPKESRADELQKITHNMCYLYGPATKAISICPPVYLADKACTRARLYLHDAFRPPTQQEIDKRSGKKDEKDENPEDEERREKEENDQLKSYQERIKIHDNLKNTMFYI